MEKKRLFVDMDGTLAVFQRVDKLETLYEKGYFRNLRPIQNVLGAVKIINENYPEIEVNILSAYLTDSAYALQEKQEWLSEHLPEQPEDRILFLPCGRDKKEAIKGGVSADDYLLDDYTKNLCLWEPPARGVKILNGINHTKETWKKDSLRYDKSAEELADNLVRIITKKEHIIDKKPQVEEECKEEHIQMQKKRTGFIR